MRPHLLALAEILVGPSVRGLAPDEPQSLILKDRNLLNGRTHAKALRTRVGWATPPPRVPGLPTRFYILSASRLARGLRPETGWGCDPTPLVRRLPDLLPIVCPPWSWSRAAFALQTPARPDSELGVLRILPLEGFAPAPTAIRIQLGLVPICVREVVALGPGVFFLSSWGFAPVRCRHLTSAACHLPSAMRLRLPAVTRTSRACHPSSIICGSNPAPRDCAPPSRGFAKIETRVPRSTGSEFQLAREANSAQKNTPHAKGDRDFHFFAPDAPQGAAEGHRKTPRHEK